MLLIVLIYLLRLWNICILHLLYNFNLVLSLIFHPFLILFENCIEFCKQFLIISEIILFSLLLFLHVLYIFIYLICIECLIIIIIFSRLSIVNILIILDDLIIITVGCKISIWRIYISWKRSWIDFFVSVSKCALLIILLFKLINLLAFIMHFIFINIFLILFQLFI